MNTQERFSALFNQYKKIGWYLASSPSGVVKYIIDNDGNKAIIEFSHNARMSAFIDLVR